MPGLQDICRQDDTYCCICEENGCSVSLSPRGDTILFADGEEAITSGKRCDCIMVLKRDDVIEVYSIELKAVRVTGPSDARGALNPDKLRQKCENCLQWALNIVNNFQSIRRNPSLNVNRYCVVIIPSEVYSNVATLIKRESRRYRQNISNGWRILPCNSPITGQAFVF